MPSYRPARSAATLAQPRRKHTTGYFCVSDAIYEEFGAKLGPQGLAVYIALSRHAGQKGECYPSHETIACHIGMSRRQVIREIHKLVELKLLIRRHRPHTSNLYILVAIQEIKALCASDSEFPERSDSESHRSDYQSPKEAPKKNALSLDKEKAPIFKEQIPEPELRTMRKYKRQGQQSNLFPLLVPQAVTLQ
jgi:DNA-binding MarR family transcriptional regulator